jgi:two-component system, chemotaxis family, chemotaxis protein CheY
VPSPLHSYKILIADADRRLAEVVQVLLESMGFSDITLTNSGYTALRLLKEQRYDFLITEWRLEEMGGLALISHIRRSPDSPDPVLPIILLTARAEAGDVMTARDHGVNEYVLKPFNAEMLFARLERLIEHPRNFVVATSFVGPCRRITSAPPQGVSERRTPQTVKPRSASQARDAGTPQLWSADDALRKKLGIGTSLSSIITPETLYRAQATIASISNESLLWIQENLNQLVAYYGMMTKGEDLHMLLPTNMSEVALTISSRAGTFGFNSASRVAYLLHSFCQNHLKTDQTSHHIVTEKHLDALKVTLSNNLTAGAAPNDDEIVMELQNLVEKYAA